MILSANFKPKRTTAASRGFFATALLFCQQWERRSRAFRNAVAILSGIFLTMGLVFPRVPLEIDEMTTVSC